MVSRPAPVGRDRYRWWHKVSMRWSDNDAYGHVNNAVHYQWFDSAVNQWLVEQGLLDIGKGDPIGLVVETGCRYFASLAYPGSVDVGIAVERLGYSSVTFRIGIFGAGDAAAAAEGHFTHVYVGRESRRPMPIPDDWRAALEKIA